MPCLIVGTFDSAEVAEGYNCYYAADGTPIDHMARQQLDGGAAPCRAKHITSSFAAVATSRCRARWRGRYKAPAATRLPGPASPVGCCHLVWVSFAIEETTRPASFDFTATAKPLLEQTGQLVLNGPVDCKIDPAGSTSPVDHSRADGRRRRLGFPAAEYDGASRAGTGRQGDVPPGNNQVAVAGDDNTDGTQCGDLVQRATLPEL